APAATLAPPLPLGASTPPPEAEPAPSKEKASQAAAEARKGMTRWHKGKPDGEPAEQQPTTAEKPERPERPQPQITRRARSGPLSVDEF
ncbi:MAG TPA: hypothetical protein VJV78_10020, partial [Polyangiales bacterium]|nr:hypothetical protein [Polyangiales bacterium]